MSVMRQFIFTIAKSRFAAMRQSPLTIKKHNLLMGFVACRMASTHHVTKNIEVICPDEPLTLEKPTGPAYTTDRPLLVLLSWMLAKKSHVMKYANLYLEQGFDVVTVNVTPWQFMWPIKGTRVVANDLLNFLNEHNNYQQIMLHGFSIGGYMWGEVLDFILKNPEKYKHVIERIVGQVWDSAVDANHLSIGTSRAIFPRNDVMQKLLQKYMDYHLKIFHTQATQYYSRSSHLYYNNLVYSPALFFLSKVDPIGTVESNMKVRDSWDSLGIPTYVKIFEKSPHVGHFRKYPKEYVNELYTFLDKLNLIKNEEKIRARLRN
ncbi:hypothetical protein PV327_004728 [Microctonus hyperodae]|uniref:Uncharacterized protein n=1 Tax=Microctonus hyperodae TaxID=165561 RepID=A0AA39FDB7_MICHY|nr:hypothetical protein PV327_004728 [Microctonus hyperodae]